MKKIIALAVSVLFVFSVAGLSFAAEKDSATKPVPAEKKAPIRINQVSGEVTAVDAAAKTVTIKSKNGEVTIATDDKTMVRVGREKKTLADIKVGDRAISRYTEVDGKNMARSIGTIAPRKEAPAKAEGNKPAAAPAEKK